jgi:dGTPase
VGEKALNEAARGLGGFIHEVHSLRVVDLITRHGKGLNLTYAVRDGIVSHCGEAFQQQIRPATKKKDLNKVRSHQSAPLTYEGCVVRVADVIAYLGRDIEDAITAGLITPQDIPQELKRTLGTTNGEIIDTLVMDVVRTSENSNRISFSDRRFDLLCRLKDFNYDKIYNHPLLLENDAHIGALLKQLTGHLFEMYVKHGTDSQPYEKSWMVVDRKFAKFLQARKALYAGARKPKQAVIDFVAGMTDSFALEAARELVFPRSLKL